jgi:RimJ/RimL family protein N-acetyltransferase
MAEFRIESERLVLRNWQDSDVDAFHAICSDPLVMATLGPLMTRDEVAALVARMQGIQAESGHCFWAIERKEDHRLIGWCGIVRGAAGTPIFGKLETGWRLASSAWGKGYAVEAATASLRWAFDNHAEDAIWAITSVTNLRSRKVMERLGMRHDGALDFDHPNVASNSPLLRHVCYCIERDDFNRHGLAV